MTWLKASDPLALLAIQAGQVQNPSQQNGAVGGGSLDTDQRAISIGEPVPIVFARRRDNAGGVLISPGATEARFENDTSNNVTAFYLLPLSEGRMDSIQVRDVFQRACRSGTFTQTYNRRAGTWQPGNFIVDRDGFDKPEASYICGSIGLYPDISTLSYQVTIPNGFDQWRRQVHLFIRGGMWVTRLADSVLGPSDNFSDLARWMLLNSGRVPSALLDTTAFTSAAQFLEANQFRCNIWIQEAENFGDFIAKLSPYFLLGESNNGGKKGLRPLLPVNNDGTINTGAIDWSYIFTENEILPGTLEIEYSNYADRQPFVAQMIWRQELEDDAAIIRTAEVRYINTAEVGPYESHDLSGFCTTETHAVKVGAYILARRVFVSHTARFAARPQAHNRLLSPGSIIRVKLGRNASGGGASEHDYLYQVERIGKTLAGDVSYECSHFPIDSQGRSIIALNVANATGTGILLTSNSTGVGCDINSATDNTIPVESFIVPGSEFDIGGFDTGTIVATDAGGEIVFDNLDFADLGSGSSEGSGDTDESIDDGGGEGPGESEENPSDGVDATPVGPFITEPVPGGEAGVPPEGLCDGAVITRIIGNIGDEGNAISETVEEFKLPTKPPEALGGDDYNGKFIEFRVSCPNGEEQVIDPVVIEELPFEATGTTGQVFTVTSQLYARTIIYIEEPFEIIEDTTTISTCFDQEISNCIFASVGSNSSVSSSGAQAGALFTFARPDGSGNSFNICSTSSAFSPIPPAKARRYIAVYGLSITGSVDGLLLQQTNFSLKNQLDQEADNWVANPTF
jgi:hypothetical protein